MFLEQQHVGAGGEIQLTDAIQSLNEINVYLLTISKESATM